MDIVTYALLSGKIKDYASNVDEWLEENVDPDTGYVLDRSLQMENAAAPADMVGEINDEVGDLKNTLNHMESGVNENMTAGNAMQLNSNLYAEDQEPYLFRQTGGSVETGNREEDTIIGATVYWNQILNHGDFGSDYATYWRVYSGTGSVSNGELTVTGAVGRNGVRLKSGYYLNLIANHKYLVSFDYKATVPISTNVIGSAIANLPATNTWLNCARIVPNNADGTSNADTFIYQSGVQGDFSLRKFFVTDLTAMFGSTIADRAYALEHATAGSGIAWLKSMGFFTQDYYPYDTGTLKSVEGLQSHDMRDANDTVIASYPLDSDLTLRGIPKLDANNKLYYDGDTYEADGSVTRRYGIRSYQSGDESLADAVTDGTNTVYKLATPTTETADPFQTPQICDPSGTEEYVTTGIVPVGHETKYPPDQVKKLDNLPSDLSFVGPIENGATCQNANGYLQGQYFVKNNQFCKAKTAIASGATFTLNTNYEVTTVAAELYAAINS